MNLAKVNLRRTLLAFALGLSGACGYQLAGTALRLPPDIRSISVATVDNATTEHGWEKILVFALEREIAQRQQLRWEPDPSQADALITGKVRSISVRPVAFNSRDQAMQYELAVVVDLKLSRRADGTVLWHTESLRVVGEYATSANVIVTSAAAFQLQPLDAKNLRDPQWNPQSAVDREAINVQLAESEKRQLLERLARQVARDAYNAMVEDF
ncbi:MAG: LPS assembly lipoprotein LptE [Candidatus Binatia bacterium]|nr:LPS assembly lipoprotein LptE [Candidatus Binatia bacterium]